MIAHPLLRALLSYWQGLCPDQGLPSRKQLDPLLMPKGLLKNFFIYEVHRLAEDRLDYLMALAGGGLCALFGREMRGLRFDEIHPKDVVVAVREEFNLTVREGCPHYAQRWGHWSADGPLPYECQVLPFSTDGRTVTELAGAAFFDPDFPLRNSYRLYSAANRLADRMKADED
jgi:hypothetical protein